MKRFELKVITRAKKEELTRISENSYKLKLFVPPEKGKANKRIIQIISQEFGVRPGNVRIVRGEKASGKIVEVDI